MCMRSIGNSRVTLVPLFQNEVSRKTFLMKMGLICVQTNELIDETHFHVNGVARRLNLLQRSKATQKWSISSHIFCSTVQCFSIPCQEIIKVPYLTLEDPSVLGIHFLTLIISWPCITIKMFLTCHRKYSQSEYKKAVEYIIIRRVLQPTFHFIM